MTSGAQEVFAVCAWSGIICAYIAKKKGRSPWLWGALGFILIGPIAGLLIHVIIGALVGFTQ